MSSQSEAEQAKDALHGKEFSGRTLNIDEAKPPRNRDRGGYR
jgi:RNA recognition motif-containing protein